jgi:hypothetical protein
MQQYISSTALKDYIGLKSTTRNTRCELGNTKGYGFNRLLQTPISSGGLKRSSYEIAKYKVSE